MRVVYHSTRVSTIVHWEKTVCHLARWKAMAVLLLVHILWDKDTIERIGLAKAPPFLLMNQTAPIDGWCDDPLDVVNYNKYVTLPFQGSHEDLWLTDSAAYDLMLVIGYNDDPVIVGKGSAIFFHVTETFGPTAGCVALSLGDMQEVLSQLTPDNAFITILPAAAVE